MKERERGITLVALVVTIVVLLILAGITITYVFGDNSIFKQALNVKLETELTKIEEKASIIYSDKWLEKVSSNSDDKPTMQEIVEELKNQGDKIEEVAVDGNKITGISLDRESMSIGKGKTNTIKVTLEGVNTPYIYYVLVEGKYYQMNFNGGLVTIERTPSEITGEEGEKINLIATSGDEEIATVVANDETNTVAVTAKEQTGTVKITVIYGEYSKTCEVKVCEVATELEVSSVRARIATDYTRWLNAVAKPEATASQELEWSSSNTDVATVDNKGVITAKQKGTATITVKTTDGSNLSKTCEVTVDDAVDVTTLTEIQTGEKNIIAKDSNGNLITVPIGFKVLTSEGTKVTDGIVVSDNENEFVWVPVDSVSTGTSKPSDDIRLGRYDDFATKNAIGNYVPKQDADNYTEVVTISSYYQELVSNSGNTSAKNLEDFVTKTQANGGYYFARYEASKGTDNKVKSQYDKVVWTNINQPDTSIESRKMYQGNNYIESDLVNSYVWDTTIIFIQKYSGNSNYASKTSVNSSKVNTGRAGDKVCNIHDMTSNCNEWSTEHSTSKSNVASLPCVNRGGSYEISSFTASGHSGSTVTGRGNSCSFRPICYLK